MSDDRHPRRGRASVVLALVTLSGAALSMLSGACKPSTTAPARTWPPGTVLVLDDQPILAEEVDAIGSMIARTEPDFVLVQLRRIALTNFVFQRKAAIALGGPRYAEARKTATELARALQAGEEPDPKRTDILRMEAEGNFKGIGLEAWNWAVDQPLGTWSDPIETEGAFEIVRVDSRTPAQVARGVVMKITIWFVPYVLSADSGKAIEDALDHSRIEYIDETWREYVPESWKHRLRGGTL